MSTSVAKAKAPDPSDKPHPVKHFLLGLVRKIAKAPLSVAFLWPVLLAIAAYVAWIQWGVDHVVPHFSRLESSHIQLTERPDYIPERVDLTAEVLAGTGMGELSLLDRQVSARIAEAYSTHAWIEQVKSVRVGVGGEIQVHVQYRQPVAMVRHLSRHPDVQGWAYYPVDRMGIVLPPDSFGGKEAEKYLVINIPEVDPRGTEGVSIGDSRVVLAASLAAILMPHREELGLAAIELHPTTGTNRHRIEFDVVTQSGRRLVWGSPPGEELMNEPSADLKLKALFQSPPPGTDLRMAALAAHRKQIANDVQ